MDEEPGERQQGGCSTSPVVLVQLQDVTRARHFLIPLAGSRCSQQNHCFNNLSGSVVQNLHMAAVVAVTSPVITPRRAPGADKAALDV